MDCSQTTYRFLASNLLPCILFSLLTFGGCALSPVRTKTPTALDSKKEQLIAPDIGRGGELFLTRWCGNDGLIYRIYETGEAEMLDFVTGKRTPIDIGPHDSLLNCTPDGKKLFYLPAERRRVDDSKDFELPGTTADIYMYDTATGEKASVASIRGGPSYDAVSPDGKKILLGQRHKLAAKTGASELEGVWYTGKWGLWRARWLPDSSGILGPSDGYADTICMEVLGKGGWAKCFNMGSNTDAPQADWDKNLYYLFVDFDPMTELEKRYLHRCDIKDKELSCERLLDGYDVMPTYGFLPDGDIVFQEYAKTGDCILRITPGQQTAECAIFPGKGDPAYDDTYLIGVSPGGRWLIFDRHTTKGWKKDPEGMRSDMWQGKMDLFVIDLTEE